MLSADIQTANLPPFPLDIAPVACSCTSPLCPRHTVSEIWLPPPSRGLITFAERARRGGKHSPEVLLNTLTLHTNLYLPSPVIGF